MGTQRIRVEDEVFVFPADMSDAEISTALNGHFSNQVSEKRSNSSFPVTSVSDPDTLADVPSLTETEVRATTKPNLEDVLEKSNPISIIEEEAGRLVDSIGPAKAAMEMYKKYTGEIASIPGGTAGMEIGAALAPKPLKPIATIAAGAVGAGVGQFIGEIAEDEFAGRPRAYREALDKGIETAKWDAAGGLILSGVGTVTSAALRSAGIKSKDDAIKTARELLQKYGADLTWHQATGSKVSSLVEGIGRVGLFGSEILEAAAKRQEKALSTDLDTLFTSSTASELGETISTVHIKATKNMRDTFSPKYDVIYAAGSKIPVALTKFNSQVQRDLIKARGARKSVNAKAPSDNVNKVNSIVSDFSDVATLPQLNESLKQIKGIKETAELTGDSAGVGYAKKYINLINKEMDIASKKLAPDLKKDLDNLNSAFKLSINRLSSVTMKKGMKKDPEKVGAWLYSNPTKAKDFKKFLGEARNQKAVTPEEYQNILLDYQSGYIKSLIKDEGAELSDMVRLSNSMKKSSNRERMETVLTRPVIKRLTTILDTAKIAEEGVRGKFGLIVGSKQAEAAKSALIGAQAFTVGIPTAVVTLSTPWALARAASTARTTGEWLRINRLVQVATKNNSQRTMEMAAKRAAQLLTDNNMRGDPE